MVDTSKAVLAAAVFITAAALAPLTSDDAADVIVHEWGTFTSVAGSDGRPVAWRPLTGPPDLPGFVRHTDYRGWKATLTATVRMETPVLYFYATEDAVVDVTVGFRQGLITEYFPQAIVSPARPVPRGLISPGFSHSIAWRGVRIQPGAPPQFPVEAVANHYYAARETEAAPLQVGSEQERFLFYRGAGTFPLPVAATVAVDGGIEVANIGSQTLTTVVLFENRGGRIGWRVHRRIADEARIPPPALDGDLASVRSELEQVLVAEGLYEREAAAMVNTWSDSWFEEGTRLFYVLPQPIVDAILPLDIRPAPSRTVRVFVGRLELVTAATLTDLTDALRTNDRARLMRYGRFLRPFAERLPAADRAQLEAVLQTAAAAAESAASVRD